MANDRPEPDVDGPGPHHDAARGAGTRSGATRGGATRCSATQCGAPQRGVTPCGATHFVAALSAALGGGIAAGVLLASGFVTAPVAFRELGDPALAGRLAGNVFAWSYAIVTLVALVAALAAWRAASVRVLRTALLLAAAGGIEWLVLTPLILARGAGLGIPFAWLHGAATLLHVVALGLACVLVWRTMRAATAPA